MKNGIANEKRNERNESLNKDTKKTWAFVFASFFFVDLKFGIEVLLFFCDRRPNQNEAGLWCYPLIEMTKIFLELFKEPKSILPKDGDHGTIIWSSVQVSIFWLQ